MIGRFFDEVGGAKAMSLRVGASHTALRTAKHRARLPARWKKEMLDVADEIGFDLDPEIFEAL